MCIRDRVNIVAHTIELEAEADSIPQYLEIDVSALDIGTSLHITDVKLPKGVKTLARDADMTLVTIVPPSGYGEEAPAAGAAPAAAAPAAGAKAPAAGAKAPAAGAKAPAAAAPAKKK